MRRSISKHSNILITGTTGLIGGEILRRLLARGHRGRVWALIRPSGGRTPAERLHERLARSGEFLRADAADAVAGDILEPFWGLSESDRAQITESVDVIVHNAADTSFAAHRDTATTNVAGVRRLIEFARGCRRAPLIAYMSTASNVGRETGRCLVEDDGCRPTNEHFNDYTHSKAVGEQELRDSGLPVLTLRPTIVLSADLPDPVFARQILWCAPLTRAFGALPIDPNSRLDLVDVGFVAEATLRLLECPSREHDCYHLSAGAAGCVTVGELERIVARVNRRRTPLRLVPPAEWRPSLHRTAVDTPLRKRVFRSLRHYLPFLNMDVVYDDARLRAVVPAAELPVRPSGEYLPELLALIREKAALQEACLP
ncbi:SDR family oxidoreductase [Gemmata sp. JC717]|uniref:SDR family oxidoreductase n=1 Tax=Gemmata algarum TaxID=2975278 RepID=A0ABU5F6E7_9BACT|nr:SDR family oxidoreductase [Gemmata algarum]MDY3551937.1 SDR family oxidoreductase [Gemmata algarum]MDY3561449.1 SDR family oxidoreductase [Gemmata algarum]